VSFTSKKSFFTPSSDINFENGHHQWSLQKIDTALSIGGRAVVYECVSTVGLVAALKGARLLPGADIERVPAFNPIRVAIVFDGSDLVQ